MATTVPPTPDRHFTEVGPCVLFRTHPDLRTCVIYFSSTKYFVGGGSRVRYIALSGNSIQGGAIGNPTGKTGKTSRLENGMPFPPDNYSVRHTKAGLVSAVRSNTNGDIDSRFFVQTEDDAGWADGRYAAFGIVLDDEGGMDKGMDIVRRISRVDVKTPQNSPKEPVTIVGCGVL
jgi:cyclophilin family peptidyl-prolyl cis-trans isomerase